MFIVAELVSLRGHSKIDKTKILMTNGSLMKVESIAECSHSVILWTCIIIIGIENQFFVFFLNCRLRHVLYNKRRNLPFRRL